MVAYISEGDVLPNDPLAVTLKKAFGDQGGIVQQADLEQFIATHGSGLEKGLQALIKVNPERNGVMDYLRTIYRTALREVRSRNGIELSQLAARGSYFGPSYIDRPALVQVAGVKEVEIIRVPSSSTIKKEPFSTKRGTLPVLRLPGYIVPYTSRFC
jgi:hypothetical protein